MGAITSAGYNEMLILDPLKQGFKLDEHEEQVRFVRWLDWYGERTKRPLLYFAVPNGGERSKSTAGKLKAEGVRAGVPDIVIALPEGRTLWIEMKVRNGGRVSPEQREFHRNLEARGHSVYVARGAREAAEIVKKHLGVG